MQGLRLSGRRAGGRSGWIGGDQVRVREPPFDDSSLASAPGST